MQRVFRRRGLNLLSGAVHYARSLRDRKSALIACGPYAHFRYAVTSNSTSPYKPVARRTAPRVCFAMLQRRQYALANNGRWDCC